MVKARAGAVRTRGGPCNSCCPTEATATSWYRQASRRRRQRLRCGSSAPSSPRCPPATHPSVHHPAVVFSHHCGICRRDHRRSSGETLMNITIEITVSPLHASLIASLCHTCPSPNLTLSAYSDLNAHLTELQRNCILRAIKVASDGVG